MDSGAKSRMERLVVFVHGIELLFGPQLRDSGPHTEVAGWS